jgi:hypothetical protein
MSEIHICVCEREIGHNRLINMLGIKESLQMHWEKSVVKLEKCFNKK